jgi:PAS domain S-box-containing protein
MAVRKMGTALRVLILEDRPADAELLVSALEQAGFEPDWTRVDTEAEYAYALARHPDIVLAEYSLPEFGALDALRLVHNSGLDIPVIAVSGAMSGEDCVECLRHGAVDYLIKDRLARLGPAVHDVLNQRREVAARHRAEYVSGEHEQRFRAAFDHAPVGMAVTELDGRVVEVNRALCELTGLAAELFRDRVLTSMISPDDRAVIEAYLRRLLDTDIAEAPPDVRLEHQQGHVVWAQYSASLIRNPTGLPRHIVHQLQDVTERRRAEQAIQRQAEQLARVNGEMKDLDRLKTEFVATVSHELRTPLTSIRGYTEILADGDSGELTPQVLQVVDIIAQNSDRLLRLVEDLLTFSRIEVGRLVLARRQVDVAALVERACLAINPALEKGALTLIRDLPTGRCDITCDPAQLERVLLGLLTNAVKFTPDGGTITVRVRRVTGQVTISVSDTGIGIPWDEQQNLFSRFFRSSNAQELAIRGTGLGLAIAKAVIDAHHGWITIDSAPGTGTTVAIGLPDTTDDPPGTGPAEAEPAQPTGVAAGSG